MSKKQTFKLVMGDVKEGRRYHIGRINTSKQFNIQEDLEEPVYLFRGNPNLIDLERQMKNQMEVDQKDGVDNKKVNGKNGGNKQELNKDDDQVDVDNDDDVKMDGDDNDQDNEDQESQQQQQQQKQKRKKQKVQVYHSAQQWQEKLQFRLENRDPYIMMDGSESNIYIGNLERSNGSYVLFMHNSSTGGFSVVPVSNIYKFTPRITYRTLTLEEAEEKMGQKRSNRWLMHKLEDASGSDVDSKSVSSSQSLQQQQKLEIKKEQQRRKKEALLAPQEDEQLYEAIFDDDDES
ncbi:hypothetical protein MIR68_012520 [Amoeboaphelidium protococcarum]|nr:hypothetical protein MIR68_012520 [Amoeboaphelidium protococcarum]